MSTDMTLALQQLEKEKGITQQVILDAIEVALISAFKKNFGSSQKVRVEFEFGTGAVKVFSQKIVVESPDNDLEEISLTVAKEINSNLELGDIAEIEVTPKSFGRIAAQTAKQVVLQRLKDAERGIVYDEYLEKEGEIITGTVQRVDRKNVIIELGKAEGILTANEQVPAERYNFGDRLKLYVVDVNKTNKGPQVSVSRSHPGLVKRLFELEVPEIHEGIVEVVGISREPGSRTKIAVYSKDENVDCVGACVGQRGSRVQSIVEELKGEKIDIIKWSSNPLNYISSSLSPSKVMRVDIWEKDKTASVVVPDYQLSLAIGKEGQNVRLAAKLTGWKIDIKSETQFRDEVQKMMAEEGHESDIEYNEEYQDEVNPYQQYDEIDSEEIVEDSDEDIEN